MIKQNNIQIGINNSNKQSNNLEKTERFPEWLIKTIIGGLIVLIGSYVLWKLQGN